jgi:hypothetical protein
MCPAVWPGTSITWKRSPSTSATSPWRQRRERLGDALARGAPHRRSSRRMQGGHAARVIGVVVRD